MATEKNLFSPAILNAETIGMLDEGAAAMAIDRALDSVIWDVENRGADGKARQVTIVLTFKKDMDVTGNPVNIDLDVKTKMPALCTNRTTTKITLKNGKPELRFSPQSAGNPDQRSIVDPDTGEVSE